MTENPQKPTKEEYASIGLHTEREINLYEKAIEEMNALKSEQRDLMRRVQKLMADQFLDGQPLVLSEQTAN